MSSADSTDADSSDARSTVPTEGPGVRVRFAPAPTGYLHLGSARTALFNWLLARSVGGTFLLRIEDTDVERSRPELIDVIFEALEWLGIDWDEEPVFQSARNDRHQAAVDALLAAGLAYWSDPLTEAERERFGGRAYDPADRDRSLGPGEGRAVRFRAPDEGATSFEDLIRGEITVEHRNVEDFVLRRADGSPVFFVANAVDDADMAVNHIVRGEDLINITPKVLLLRDALDGLGFFGPTGAGPRPRFAHLPLIVNEQRKKLSKRRDDVSLLDYRARGYLPEAMVNYLALLGWGPADGVEVRPLEEIISRFRIADVNQSSAMFDQRKLRFVNEEKIKALSPAELLERSRPWLAESSFVDRFDEERFLAIAPELLTRVKTLEEVPGYVDFLFLTDPVVDEDAWRKVMSPEPVRGWLRAVIDRFGTVEWTAEALHAATGELGTELGEPRLGRFQAPIRVAVTGRTVGPPLFESLVVLGRNETLRRLEVAAERP